MPDGESLEALANSFLEQSTEQEDQTMHCSLLKYAVVIALCCLSVWIGTRSSYNAAMHRHLRAMWSSGLRQQHLPDVLNMDPKSVEIIDSITKYAGGHDDGQAAGDDHGDDHAVDDHAADDHATGHPSLFEALSAIHIEIGTYSVLIIIGFIIVLKQLIEALYTFTAETAFHGMVKKIEEELMIVGSSSFIFKVVLNTTSFGENKWAYPLEFGEVLVPLIAFSYCGIGIFLVMVSLKQCYTWSRAHNLKAMEILDDYFTASKSWTFRLLWMPLNPSIEQMEFRIFHNIFCKAFKIRKGAFAFDEYVAKVFQRSVLELIEIRLLDWFYVSVLLLLNEARVKLNLHMNSCGEDIDEECDSKRTVRLFTLVGAIIFCLTFLLLVLSRRLELAIMSRNGPKSHLEYAQSIKEEDEKDAIGHTEAMDLNQLKVAAAKAKEKEKEKEHSVGTNARMTLATLKTGVSMRFTTAPGASNKGGGFFGKSFIAPRHGSSDSGKVAPIMEDTTPPPSQETGKAAEEGKRITSPATGSREGTEVAHTSAGTGVANHHKATVISVSALSNAPKPQGGALDDLSDISSEDLDEAEEGPGELVQHSPRQVGGAGAAGAGRPVGANASGVSFAEKDSEGRKPETAARAASGGSAADRSPASAPSSRNPSRRISGLLIREPSFGQHSKEAMDVFWCGKPELYFESVQVLFMIISFYAALWLTVMASSSSSVWRFLSILPAILILSFFFYIVKTAALLKAIYEVDTDAMLEVIEETEAAKQLAIEVRDRVLERLDATGEDPFEEIQRLYNEIDVNRSDSLSRREFGQFMELMGISFSAKKWERIYKEIDRNFDNEISLNEFLLFIYPDHDAALSMENKRLKAISQRVMDRANNLLSSLTPITEIITHAATATVPGAAAVVGERRSTTVTPAARRRSVIAHIHPDMSTRPSRQNSQASNAGSATKDSPRSIT